MPTTPHVPVAGLDFAVSAELKELKDEEWQILLNLGCKNAAENPVILTDVTWSIAGKQQGKGNPALVTIKAGGAMVIKGTADGKPFELRGNLEPRATLDVELNGK